MNFFSKMDNNSSKLNLLSFERNLKAFWVIALKDYYEKLRSILQELCF